MDVYRTVLRNTIRQIKIQRRKDKHARTKYTRKREQKKKHDTKQTLKLIAACYSNLLSREVLEHRKLLS